MDEIIFRSSQRIETMQLQGFLLITQTKDFFVSYSQQIKLYFLQLWNSTRANDLKLNVKGYFEKVLCTIRNFRHLVNPRHIYVKFTNFFGRRLTKRDICFGCAGLIIGGLIGFTIGLLIRKKPQVLRYMQAIQCHNYLGTESITVVEDAIAPYECGEYDVLVNVKAASVQIIDAQICNGYGKTLRHILQKTNRHMNCGLPVTLGRECTGIISDIGSKVRRLEVGDEVWLAVPFWFQGTLCQTVLVPEHRISRKPKNIGFEAACSLPYAGSLALTALKEANLSSSNAYNKNILVHGGSTPVGCVLIQLLTHWKAAVTATCHKRAVPVIKALGASDIIIFTAPSALNDSSCLNSNNQETFHGVLKELELKGNIYDVIIKTSKEYNFSIEDLKQFCKSDGAVISTLPPLLSSDGCGFFAKFMLSLYIRLKYKLQNILRLTMNDFDETHLCYVTLDRLAKFVEDGNLQTVVDKVFQPQDIELAINHIQSPPSIGSTVITFR